MLEGALAKVFGTKHDREIKALRPIVAAINDLEEYVQDMEYSLGWLLRILRSVYDRRIAGASRFKDIPSISFKEILSPWGQEPGPGETP